MQEFHLCSLHRSFHHPWQPTHPHLLKGVNLHPPQPTGSSKSIVNKWFAQLTPCIEGVSPYFLERGGRLLQRKDMIYICIANSLCLEGLVSHGVGRGGGQAVLKQILTRFHGIRLNSGRNPLSRQGLPGKLQLTPSDPICARPHLAGKRWFASHEVGNHLLALWKFQAFVMHFSRHSFHKILEIPEKRLEKKKKNLD